jgi:hypothetical protein
MGPGGRQLQRNRHHDHRDAGGNQRQHHAFQRLPQPADERGVRAPEHDDHDLYRDETEHVERHRPGEGAEVEQPDEHQRDGDDDRAGDDSERRLGHVSARLSVPRR